jgi:hypothetical protein
MVHEQIKNLHDQTLFLTKLSKCKNCKRLSLLKNADKEQIDAICQIVYNLLEGRLPITEKLKLKLSDFRHSLRKITKVSNLKTKKKILVQNGGFLQFLLPAILPLLPSLISAAATVTSSLISKKQEDSTQE